MISYIKDVLIIVTRPVTDSYTGIKHKPLRANFWEGDAPRAVAEVGTAGKRSGEEAVGGTRLARATIHRNF